MLTFLQSLTPEQQAALVGLVVAALMYLARLAAPALFENCDTVSKFQRTAAAVLLSLLGVFLQTAGSWPGAGAFLLSWALAYATAEGAHTVVSRTAAMR